MEDSSLLSRVLDYDGQPYTRRVIEEIGAKMVLPNGQVLIHCREETDEEMSIRIMKQLEAAARGEDNE